MTNKKRSASAAAIYATSPLRKRNEAVSRASGLSLIRAGHRETEKLVESGRITTAIELIQNDPKCGALIDSGKEPYLLVEDMYNDGSFSPIAIHDQGFEPDGKDKLCPIELMRGSVLVKPDTLVYWK